MRIKLILASIALGLLLLAIGCGGGGSSTTQVRLLLGDGVKMSEGMITAVNVAVQRVELLSEADVETTNVVLYDAGSTPYAVNLLSLANQSLTQLPDLGTVSIPAGHYSQMRVILASPNTVIMADDATEYPLTVASGQQTGFKVNINLDLSAGTFSSILLDFNLARLQKQGSEFHLTPNALRVIELSQAGSIDGTLTLPEGYTQANDLQVTITLVDAQSAPVTDVNGNTITTQVTLPVAEPVTSAAFVLNGVAAGSYSLQVDTLDGTTAIPAFTVPVTVTSGQSTAITVPLQGLTQP
ncbi:MAG: DUF4382 domain-containing protein [Armatimonadota bacterium]